MTRTNHPTTAPPRLALLLVLAWPLTPGCAPPSSDVPPAARPEPGVPLTPEQKRYLAFLDTPRGRAEARRALDRVFGEDGPYILGMPNNIRIYRIDGDGGRDLSTTPLPEDRVAGYPVVEALADLYGYENPPVDDLARRLGTFLLDGRRYGFLAKKCELPPRLGLRLGRGAAWMDLAVCPECGRIEAVTALPDFLPARESGGVFARLPGEPDVLAGLVEEASALGPSHPRLTRKGE